MRLTISNKVAATGIAVLLLSVGTAGVGLVMNQQLGDALHHASISSAILRNHMQADMMHDALRSDVFGAMLAPNPANGVSIEAVKADLAEHRDSFEQSLTENRALATDPEMQAALGAVEAPLNTYIAAASEIVELAESDVVAAQGKMADFQVQFTALETAMSTAADKIEATADKNRIAADAAAETGRLVMMAAILAALAISIGVMVAGSRGVVAPIRRLTVDLRAMAQGQTDVKQGEARRQDEVGDIARAVVDIQALIVARAQAEAAEADRRRTKEEQDRAVGDQSREAAAREQAVVVSGLTRGLDALAQADLTVRITDAFPPVYEQLRTNFNAAVEGLQEAIGTIAANTGAINAGAAEIAKAADELSRRTEQQAASLEETAAALEEVTATVRATASGAVQAAGVVQAARTDADKSGAVVRDAVTAMGEIERSSAQINQIIGVIDEIAFQTNLLALNAGVEAARAGESGRGFAVVASEVRALAERSADAAKEIKALISQSTVQVGSGVKLVTETGQALDRIVAHVAQIEGLVTEISSSAAEQATGLQQVNTAVNQMDQMTQQNAAMVEESTAASHSLSQEADGLAAAVSRFQVGGAAKPARVVAAPTHRPVAALKTVGRGGAAPAPASAPDADGWESF
ncbi:HAMP domain-containing methyl-accepting chemotaxis protein [Brevundimonas sp. SL130]|uniref:HAMP domain-containing methyl-accepting chemotaxis protein n=1 Tax=Brevundimonas sp. SL130 TaxID=2995143 RepID=UPI00226CA517|nr:methyl-accepting chemotaxis protein [Brevundimonas sp. SL130]WAC59453.1 methyl-accepting chemotaxis protein [Brevundimonas sp. SL130]